MAYADDVNLVFDDIRTIERNADGLFNALNIGLAVNIGKLKCIEVGGHWDMLANNHIMEKWNPLNI